MKINQILITTALLSLTILGAFTAAAAAQINEKLTLENQILRKEKEIKIAELDLKHKKVQVEKLKSDIEQVRLQAFLNAYANKEYIVEVKK